MPQSLRNALAEYPRIMLEAIAEGWGIALTDEQTPEIAERLATEMVNPESVQFLLRHLNEVEREALAYVVAVGQVKGHVMARKYGAIRPLGPGRLEWEAAWRQPISATERLWFLGLVYREFGKNEHFHGEVFTIPEDLRGALPPLDIHLPVFHVEAAPGSPVVRDDGDALAHDAFVVISYLRRHEVRERTPRRGRGLPQEILTARDLATLRRRWVGQSDLQEGARERSACPPRLSFLLHLCATAQLVALQDNRWTPTARAAAWLRAGDLARWRVLYQAWLDDADWNELWLMPGVQCEDTGWRNDPLLPRQVVVDYLRRCPVSTWLTLDSFVDSLHEVDPDLMRPDGDYESWYIRDARTGQYLVGYDSWDKVEGALIRHLLQCPMRWLGVVAVGQVEGKAGSSAFMLTPQGAAVLGAGEVTREQSRPMTVQADLQVVVPREASWYDRFLLERLARWVGEKDGVARYHLDAEAVRTYLQTGVTIERVLAFLRRVTGNRLPPGVARELQSWAAQND